MAHFINILVIEMNEKRTRYITHIFTLDRNYNGIESTTWDKDDLKEFLQFLENHSGLKIISGNKEVSIRIEYSNIIWDYKLYFGSYKKRFKVLVEDDERWFFIEKGIQEDLKMMGLEELYDVVITHLKRKEYFEYNKKCDSRFKRYCV